MESVMREKVGYRVDEALVLLQKWFYRRALRMSRDNKSLIEDLAQEMCMGVLLSKGDQALQYYKDAAINRARMYLRGEARQAMRGVRYQRLSHRKSENDETPYIEGLIDLHDSIRSRPEAIPEIPEYALESRISA